MKIRGASWRHLSARFQTDLALFLGAALAIAVFSSPALADLQDDTRKLRTEWQKLGRVSAFKPQLFERGSVRPIPLTNDALNPNQADCTTVAVVGAPSANFVMRSWEGVTRSPLGAELPEVSIAGAAQLTRCGPRKLSLARLAVEMRSPRAVLEVLVVRSKLSPALLHRVLPNRDPGPIAPFANSGPRPSSAPVSERARSIEQRVRREGAVAFALTEFDADAAGSGEKLLRLEAGCHRLDLLGLPVLADASRGGDIDAELFSLTTGELVGADHSESADASLSLCLGEMSGLRVRFAGARPSSPIMMLQSRWELPDGLADYWGPAARGRMASSIQAHAHLLAGSPVYDSLGVAGVTGLPLAIEPGACYVVGLTAIRGVSSGLAMALTIGNNRAQNHGGSEGRGTALAFCGRTEEGALLEVEARGVGLVWLLAVWQTARVPIGEVHE